MLKNDLNSIFTNNRQSPQAQGEVDLFRALMKAMNNNNWAYCKEYHGNVGQVEHILQHPHDGKHIRSCEIADILMIFIDNDNNMRYTFMQNKRDKKTPYYAANPLQRTRADCVQWDLLHHRCYLSDPLSTNLPRNILSSAILSSVATYGIFVNEANSTSVEMSYNIAKSLTPRTPTKITPKSTPRAYDISTRYNILNFVDGYWEIDGTATLDDFEMAAKAMLIGTPVEKHNPHHSKIAQLLLSFAATSLQSEHNSIEERNLPRIHRMIRACAQAYEVELNKGVFLPYHLVVVNAQNTCFATRCEKYFSIYENCRHNNKLEFMHDKTKLYQKIEDDDFIVFIDSCLLDDEMKLYLKSNDRKCYIVKFTQDEIGVFPSDKYLEI